MKRKIIINTDNLTGVAPLYYKLKGQANPQAAYIEIDFTAEVGVVVSADYSGEVGGGDPINVWSGRIKRITVNPCVIGPYLADAMNDSDFMVLIGRVANGYSEDYFDGNLRGFLYEDSMMSMDLVGQALANIDQAEIYTAEEWLDPNYLDADGRTGDETDAVEVICGEVEVTRESDPIELAKECEAYVDSHQVVDGIEAFLVKTVELLKLNYEDGFRG